LLQYTPGPARLTGAAYQFVSSAPFAEACCGFGGERNKRRVASVAAAADESLVNDVCHSSVISSMNSSVSVRHSFYAVV